MKRETALILFSLFAAGPVLAQQTTLVRKASAQPENDFQQPRSAASQDQLRKDKRAPVGPNFASPSQTPEIQNPLASDVEASVFAALQRQKQIVDAEVLNQTKLAVHPAGLLTGTSAQPMASGTGPLLNGRALDWSSAQTPPKAAGGTPTARNSS